MKRRENMKISRCLLVLVFSFMLHLHAEDISSIRWQERKKAVMQDTRAVRYYTFEGLTDSKSPVKDVKGSGADLLFVPFQLKKEKFDDLKIIEGRWPGKPAVRLDQGWYQGAPADIENNQFTVEVWFRRNGPGTQKHTFTGSKERADGGILSTANGMTKGWRLVTVYNQRQSLEFFMGNSQYAKSSRLNTHLSVPDGVWQHLAATWDGSEMKMYLNGIPAGSLKYEGPYVKAEKNEFFKIGYLYAGVGSVILDVDEVVIYNRALDPGEIEKLGRSGVSGVEDIMESGDRLLREGKYTQARSEYGKLMNFTGIDYGKPMALLNVAESYRLEKNYAKAHETYDELIGGKGISDYYRIHALFRKAETHIEEKAYDKARQALARAGKNGAALEHHIFLSGIKTGDTYMIEKKYSAARKRYLDLLRKEESSIHPHDVHRLELRNRLEAIEGLADGMPGKKGLNETLRDKIEKARREVYVSTEGNDANPGTRSKPFATIERAKAEARRIKSLGLPAGGVKVVLRGGTYYLDEGILFGQEDSGTEEAPVVYAGFPGENARIVGGKPVSKLSTAKDPAILQRLPGEARGKVMEADLKALGITDYGQLTNRGGHNPPAVARPGAMEVIFNGRIMTLARWPNSGYQRIAGLPNPKGDGTFRNKPFQHNCFIYSGDRPERWKNEKEVWIKGYLAETMPFQMIHARITELDTEKKTIFTAPDTRWGKTYSLYNTPYQANAPFYAYNLLSELDSPGEWYIDRDAGRLYFWPPDDGNKNETIVTTLSKPVIRFDNASHMIISGITIEGTWTHGIDIKNGRRIAVAGCTIRNTGQYAVNIKDGWEHTIYGCDMYDMGEGGVIMDAGDQVKLIPSCHVMENNHIHRFNRFCGGYRPAALLIGTGHRIAHNLIHDAPMHAIYMHGASLGASSNDHIIEFNEFHDVPYEAREFGAIYIYSDKWRMMNRGNVIRNNFFHHISYHSSPNMHQGLNAIHIDSLNGGFAVTDNVFYKVPNGISNPQPDNRLENNIFVDVESRAISQGNRAMLLNDEETGLPKFSIITDFARLLKGVNYMQPPWNYRYPQLASILSGEKMVGWSKGNVIERNANTGGPFISIAPDIKEDNLIRDNWEEGDPLFMNRKGMDFRIRTGSPVYGKIGMEPVPFEKAGVYKDPLRASWPVDRKKEDIGRYYKDGWKPIGEISKTMSPQKRVSKALTYIIPKRSAPVTIDGKLDAGEWLGLDRKKAMVIEQYYTGESKKGPLSYAWMLYDDKYLYIATVNDPDPFTEGMPPRAKNHVPMFEVSIESHNGPHSRSWWIDDMPTGPIYIFWGSADGKAQYKNNFGMAHQKIMEVEKTIEYKASILDKEKSSWVSEMKIPFESMGLKPAASEQQAFNIGVYKRGGWFTWVATGTNVWRVENAGFVKFEK